MPSTTCLNAPSRQAGGSLACPQATNKPVKAVSHRNRRGRLVTDVKRSSTFCCNHPALKRTPPNGSRLSCGRNARRRKEIEPQTKRLASEGTQFFPHERPA